MQHRLLASSRRTPFKTIRPPFAAALSVLIATSFSLQAQANEEQTLAEIVVKGSSLGLTGNIDAASSGTISRSQLDARTYYRPGELLESVPGLIVSQHSGEGKANQFYLRGFNLDHGTDLQTTVDGMLVNQRSHAHGQGWTDLNFFIPELSAGLEYKKGTYFASEGDFSSAGSVAIRYLNRLDEGRGDVSTGQNGFRRTLLADSLAGGHGSWLYALEFLHNDGPFVHPDDYRKLNGVLRYSEGDRANGFNVSAMGYKARWNATDQIPGRGLAGGAIISRFDTIDPTDGGQAHRYSLSTEWRRSGADSATRVNAYVIDNKLDLFSNFTYILDDPVNGDQFAQPDRRITTAVNVAHIWQGAWAAIESENSLGVQIQRDDIHNGLLSTKSRETLSVTRSDHVRESSIGFFAENAAHWTPQFRTIVGLRADFYRFRVDSDRPLNSGQVDDHIVSPKLSFIYAPWSITKLYFNLGSGFHSNDARGATLHVDPKNGAAADKVSPLVRSRGGEIGLRAGPLFGLQTSLSLYRLDFDSELVFAGDAGTTEASRPSRRIGVEWASSCQIGRALSLDADLSFARARFKDRAAEGNRIPGAVEGVASLALALSDLGPYSGSLQWRYFGPRPLVGDNSVRSASTAQFNARIAYRVNRTLRLELEGFNLSNRKASAIDYYYASRLPGEPVVGVNDIHSHPLESRTFRLTASARF